MARFIEGSVVVVPFPFSDLSQTVRRPALVVATMQGDDLLLCQITKQARSDSYGIRLSIGAFAEGSLKMESYLRPNKLFTLEQTIVLYKVGRLHAEVLETARDSVTRIVKGLA